MANFVSTYNPEIALGICERVAEGETLSAICAEKTPGWPTRSTFQRWVIRYPEVARAYAAAREVSAYSLEEEALDTARELKDKKGRKGMSSTEIRALEVAMNQLRWSASRRNPKVFSERGAISVTVPIQINTSLDLGGEAGIADVYTLKANVVTPSEEDGGPDRAAMQADTKPLEGRAARGPVPYSKYGKRILAPPQEAEDAQVRGSDVAGRE